MKLKHVLTGLVAFAFIVPSTSAVLGGPETGDGELAITSGGSSAGASQAVSPNGTQWRAEVSMVNRTQNISEDRLENIRYGEENRSVGFTGFISAPTPCHTISHEVRETERGYVLNVRTGYDRLDEESNRTGTCAQVLTMIEYDAEFETDEQFDLEVRHENQTVRTLEHPGTGEESDRGFLSSVFSFLGGLF